MRRRLPGSPGIGDGMKMAKDTKDLIYGFALMFALFMFSVFLGALMERERAAENAADDGSREPYQEQYAESVQM